MIYGLVLVGLFSVITFIFVRLKGVGIKALVFKVLSALIYIMISVIATELTGYSTLGSAIIIGQVFGLLGDVFLDQKYIHKEQDQAYTHLGFIAFGIGHICFMIGLLSFYSMTNTTLLAGVIVAWMVTAFVYLTQKPLGLNFGKMALDVITYSAVIGFTTFVPIIWLLKGNVESSQLIVFSVAMIAFLLSDLVLSQIYFGGKNSKGYIIANYVFYFGAQYLIALSILFI